MEKDPEKYIYYRRNKADEERYGARAGIDMRMTYKELKPVLSASVRSFSRAMDRLLKGEKVNTRYGTYWAEAKKK